MRIEREQVKIIVYTDKSIIKGTVYLPPGGRLTDYINKVSGDFVPITNAEIFIEGKEMIKTELLQLNKDYIIFVFPERAMK